MKPDRLYKPPFAIPRPLEPVLTTLPNALVVGGWVRDQVLGLPSKDLDIEVYGTSFEELSNSLGDFGKVDLVGKSFGVIKLTLEDGVYDFSLPRRDSKIPGEGHKAFDVIPDKDMSPKEAASRRDVTINSLAYDPKSDTILDFYGGLQDLDNGVLRHTSNQFPEDPLRVLRLMQFLARFDFEVHPSTLELCQSIVASGTSLPKERVGEEFHKMLTKGKNIKGGLDFLVASGWSAHFPEIEVLAGCPQDIEYHPEGDVLAHTGFCCNTLAKLPAWQDLDDRSKYTYMLGVLCHDLGKPSCTKEEFKKKAQRMAIVSPGHDKAGEVPTRSLLNKLNVPHDIIKRVVPLVTHHMDHLQVTTDEHVRRLSTYMAPESIKGLAFVTEADHSGRPPLPACQPAEMKKIIERSKALDCFDQKLKPVLQGRDFMGTGITQGKAIGLLCSAAYEAQIQGKFSTHNEGLEWYKENRGKLLENAKLGPQRVLGGKDLQAAGMPIGPLFGKLHKDLYEMQLDGVITSRSDAIDYLEKQQAVYKIPDAVLTCLRDQEIQMGF